MVYPIYGLSDLWFIRFMVYPIYGLSDLLIKLNFSVSDGRVSFPAFVGQVNLSVLRHRGEQRREKCDSNLLLGSQLVNANSAVFTKTHQF
jgi:hypothetical protein